MQVGDLVKMVQGYSEPGLILEIKIVNGVNKWAFVHWPEGTSMEKLRDLYTV